MKVLDASITVKTSHLLEIYDEELGIKWYVSIEFIDGKIKGMYESVNYKLFMSKGIEYVCKVYGVCTDNLKARGII